MINDGHLDEKAKALLEQAMEVLGISEREIRRLQKAVEDYEDEIDKIRKLRTDWRRKRTQELLSKP